MARLVTTRLRRPYGLTIKVPPNIVGGQLDTVAGEINRRARPVQNNR
jgi:hypothetical protein